MRLAPAIVLFLTFSSSLTLAGNRAAEETCAAVQSTQPSTNQNDLQALRSDLQRMNALVEQMESNLAFVDTTQSPLKHQFQLEIDMWKTVISEMERKINTPAAH